MSDLDLRFRQIHMDFHTSGDIPGIAADFDPEEFAETLNKARVDSVTCFGRCHHGWLYYDSQDFPERIHPNLEDKDLLKKQIEACHAKGIKVPIYITVQWDLYTARRHPEWRVMTEDGKLSGTPPYEAGFYQDLCVNTPYREFLKNHTKEVMEELPVDGIFFDIVQVQDCSCRYCQEDMREEGLDPSDKEDRMKFAKNMLDEFKLEMSDFVHQYKPEATVFYNAGHVGPGVHESKSAYTHFEIESLPSGGWGYIHFPVSIRYARNLDIDCLGMTGKFHTSWGDFHSFKTKEALEFECFRMLAMNAKCSVGDQLPPEGKISQPVYDLIGEVYKEVEKKEPWCLEAEAVTDIGMLTPEEFNGKRVPPAAAGAVRILEEGGHQFDILDSRSDFSDYKLLILPDNIEVNTELAKKIEDYINTGGKLIASFESGLDSAKEKFNLEELGVNLKTDQTLTSEGELAAGTNSDFDYAEYILPYNEMSEGLPDTEHVMYMKGKEIEAAEGAEVKGEVISSYFDRNWRHFCSHRHTPSSGEKDYPGIVKNDNCIYFVHPIFQQFNKNAPNWCKKLVLNAVDMLLEEPVIEHDGPSTLLTTVNDQEQENRRVVHLLHYIPERRSEEIDIIEDVIPLYDLNLSVSTDKNVEKVTCVPEGKDLDFEVNEGRIEFMLPELEGHQMIEISFK